MNLGREDEFQEFKEGLGQLDKGLKSITAMLNRHNVAIVYFGVDDNGNIVGLQVGKDTLMDIRNKMRDKIEPRIYPDIKEEKDENGKKYIKVSVTWADIPYSYDGRYYIRNVSSDEQASNEILRKMLASSDADIIRQKTSHKQNLTFKAFFAELSGSGIHPKDSEELYGNYGLLNRDGKFNLNAYLMSDENDLFDFQSFREAWINACLHNDWNNAIAPSVYMYDDRIEVVSYGGIPYSLSIEGFFSGTSVPVNKSLLTIFMAAKYAEQSGHGVPTIVEKYGCRAFSFDNGMIKVTIPLAFEREEIINRVNK